MSGHKTGDDLIAEAKDRIREISGDDALRLRETNADAVFLDVREPDEVMLGKIPGSVFLARGRIETRAEETVPRDKTVVVYCSHGRRSALAADTLQQMGYRDVYSLATGFGAWVDAGGEVED